MTDAREWLSEGEPELSILAPFMRAALIAVLDLHHPGTYGSGVDTCWGCGRGMPWPCPTIQAINEALGINTRPTLAPLAQAARASCPTVKNDQSGAGGGQ